jgi:hypothetical protein
VGGEIAKSNIYNFVGENPLKSTSFVNSDVDRRIVLKWIF